MRPRGAPEVLQVAARNLLFDTVVAGSADGPLVMLLHGFAQPPWAWSAQLTALAGAGFRAVAPVQRGYCAGARPGQVEAYRIEHLVDDVLALAAALGHTRFHLCGFDTGGAVAWHVAGSRPDALLSLTVLSTPHPRALVRALLRSTQGVRSSYIPLLWLPRLPERVLSARDGTVLARFLRATGLPADRASRYAARLTTGEELEGALAFFRAMRPSALRGVSAIDVPTVFAWGSGNRIIGRVAAQGTARYGGARYRFLDDEGAGHWLLESRPSLVTEAILGAVSSVS